MSTERFSVKQFQQALPVHNQTGDVLWKYAGFLHREHCYEVRVNPYCKIHIRSSIKADGYAATTGKDSIRAWLVDNEGAVAGAKVQSYVTRVPGWEQRLVSMLRKLYKLGSHVALCSTCNHVRRIYKVKKQGPNKGKLFTKCECTNDFKWV